MVPITIGLAHQSHASGGCAHARETPKGGPIQELSPSKRQERTPEAGIVEDTQHRYEPLCRRSGISHDDGGLAEGLARLKTRGVRAQCVQHASDGLEILFVSIQ